MNAPCDKHVVTTPMQAMNRRVQAEMARNKELMDKIQELQNQLKDSKDNGAGKTEPPPAPENPQSTQFQALMDQFSSRMSHMEKMLQ